jgi:hypothetical protein
MPDLFQSDAKTQRLKDAKMQEEGVQKTVDFKEINAEQAEKRMDVIDIMDPEERKKWWKGAAKRIVKETGETPRRVLWGAYHSLPEEKFVTQQDDEEIALLLRSHPITNIGWILATIAMLFFPTVLSLTGILSEVPFKIKFLGFLTWYLVTLMMAFARFLKWYYSVFLITNERIVDIDFANIMSRQLTSVNLNHIEEPVMSTRGFLETMFQFGHVSVQTAAEVETLEADYVPFPNRVVDIISRLSEDLEKRRERGE